MRTIIQLSIDSEVLERWDAWNAKNGDLPRGRSIELLLSIAASQQPAEESKPPEGTT